MRLALKIPKSTLILIGISIVAVASVVVADYQIPVTIDFTQIINGSGGGGNTTAEIQSAVWTSSMNFSNLTACADGQILEMVGADWRCGDDDTSSSPDTNASTACNGDTTYLDGDNNCDDISLVYYDEEADLTALLNDNYAPIGVVGDPWVNESGDNMTGPLVIDSTLNVTGYTNLTNDVAIGYTDGANNPYLRIYGNDAVDGGVDYGQFNIDNNGRLRIRNTDGYCYFDSVAFFEEGANMRHDQIFHFTTGSLAYGMGMQDSPQYFIIANGSDAFGITTENPTVRLQNYSMGIHLNDHPLATLDVNGSIVTRYLPSCDAVETDANGMLICGSDDVGGGGGGNVTGSGIDGYFATWTNASDINDSVMFTKGGNIFINGTWVNGTYFNGSFFGGSAIFYGNDTFAPNNPIGKRSVRLGVNGLSGLIMLEYNLAGSGTVWQIDNGGDNIRFFNGSIPGNDNAYVFGRVNRSGFVTDYDVCINGAGGQCLSQVVNQDWFAQVNWLNMSNISLCANGQILKVSGGAWLCADDADTGGAPADPDTNASTACDPDEFLSGDGRCFGFIDGWNRTDQGNTTAEIQGAIGDWEEEAHCDEHDGAYLSCNGEELDVDAAGICDYCGLEDTYIPDTNASTACGDNEFLDGSGSCINVVDGWNRTDQGNSTAQIQAVIWPDTNVSSWFASSGWLNMSNITACADGQILEYSVASSTWLCGDDDGGADTWIPDTNASTACSDNEFLDGSGSCIGVVDGWNRTDQGNSSAEILSIAVSRSDWTSIDNYPGACSAGQFAYGVGDSLSCAKPPDTNVSSWFVSSGWLNMSNFTACADGQIMKYSSVAGRWLCGDDSSSSSPDTNASTACIGTALLDGDGNCVSVADGWNRTDQGNTTAEIQGVAVGGEASGTVGNIVLAHDALDDQYYDSEADLTGLLNDNYAPIGLIKDPWVNTTGDRMTGNLSITNKANITQVTEILFQANQTRIFWNGTNLVIEG